MVNLKAIIVRLHTLFSVYQFFGEIWRQFFSGRRTVFHAETISRGAPILVESSLGTVGVASVSLQFGASKCRKIGRRWRAKNLFANLVVLTSALLLDFLPTFSRQNIISPRLPLKSQGENYVRHGKRRRDDELCLVGDKSRN